MMPDQPQAPAGAPLAEEARYAAMDAALKWYDDLIVLLREMRSNPDPHRQGPWLADLDRMIDLTEKGRSRILSQHNSMICGDSAALK